MNLSVSKKILAVTIIILFFGTSISNVAAYYMKNHNEAEENISEEVVYQVVTKSPNDPNRSEIITNLTEKEFKLIKETLLEDIDPDDESYHEIISERLSLLREHNLLPDRFTIENITLALEKITQSIYGDKFNSHFNDDTYPLLNTNIPQYVILPHMFIYVSFGTNAFSAPLPFVISDFIFNDTSRLGELVPPLDDLMPNAWVRSYIFFSLVEFLIGTTMGFYCNIGLYPESTFCHNDPFLAVYFPSLTAGFYVYRLAPDGKSNVPYMDFYLGFSFLSMIVTDPFGPILP